MAFDRHDPPTPPSDIPETQEDWRFHPISTPLEWVESYRPGHFHPVHIGDAFKDNRYTVIRKLGDGAFSTVWLAVDEQSQKLVALKIVVASESSDSKELSILQHLAKMAPQHTGSKHVITFLDNFNHIGPNGTHLCLVFEPLGTSAASLVEQLPCNLPRRRGHRPRYPEEITKAILRQTLLGLSFLHQNGIAHGDVQPGNLLFVPTLDSVGHNELKQDPNDKTLFQEVKRIDGKEDRWAPKYLVVGQPLTEYVDIGQEPNIKISDLGAAFWASKPPKNTVTPLGLRAPELVLGLPFHQSIDIWSFGCLLFEFVTGTPLFFVSSWGGGPEDQFNDDHLLQITDRLGDLPENLFSRWSTSDRYFGPDRKRINSLIGDIPEDFPPSAEAADSLETYFKKEKPGWVDDAEEALILGLLRKILQYDPERRPSASELLEHPWLNHKVDGGVILGG